MDIPEDLAQAAAAAPLYAPLVRGKPMSSLRSLTTWPPLDLERLLDTQRTLGDPFGGRLNERASAGTMFQMGDQLPLYWALVPQELAGAAQALAVCWRSLGIGEGDRVAIYDYGTTPLTLFASASYIPHLSVGAAEILGCTPICNDGLPEFASRALHLLRYVRPRLLFARGEVMPVLVSQAAREGATLGSLTSLVVVSSDEEFTSPPEARRWSQALGVRVRQLLRVDAALFFAPPCQSGDVYHVDNRYYLVEALSEPGLRAAREGTPGRLAVTNLFLRTCPVIRYVSDMRASVRRGACRCGWQGATIKPAD